MLLDSSHVCSKGNEKGDAAAKAGPLRRVTHVPVPFGDFKKHINVLMKCQWQFEWNDAINNNLL